MARFSNFSMWRGRLPHWRADGENYYVQFRHRRALEHEELRILFHHLMKLQRRSLDILIMVSLPEGTEAIFRVQKEKEEDGFDFSDGVEKAKRKAGAQIIKRTGEKWPPFYGESYDRILRDAAELEEFAARIFASPEAAELAPESEEYEFLFSADLSELG